jgi:maleylpyruvate isomerase
MISASAASPTQPAQSSGADVPAQRQEPAALQTAIGYLDAVDEATATLYEVVGDLDQLTVRGPSLLAGWSRAHVITHLARNADALVNLLTWAKTGVEHQPYASRADRDADIEEGAGRSLQLLRADLDWACLRFAAAARDLPPGAWEAEVAAPQGTSMIAHQVPFLRLREVWLHTVDLDRGVTLTDVPERWLEPFLDDAVTLLDGRADVPALRLEVDLPGTGQRTWEINIGGNDSSVTVRGSASDVLGWLTGRRDGSGLGGNPPRLPDWA